VVRGACRRREGLALTLPRVPPAPCILQVSEALWPSVHDCYHLHDVMGSDHCPVGVVLKNLNA
jgi:hypothetical protein